MKRLLVVDVGTHKGQEVRLLADRGWRWRFEMFTSLARHHRKLGRAWSDFRMICRLQNRCAEWGFCFMFIEPIFHREIADAFTLAPNIVFIKGVTSANPGGEVTLRLACTGDLGHSIIPSKPNLSDRGQPTLNFDFRELLPWFRACFGVREGDIVVLRMNAEGVERDIVEWVTSHGDSSRCVDVFMGSLGDVKKCFGADAERDAQRRLSTASIPFIYLTSNPGSWRPALEALLDLVSATAQIEVPNA
jgi:hypothetical protein